MQKISIKWKKITLNTSPQYCSPSCNPPLSAIDMRTFLSSSIPRYKALEPFNSIELASSLTSSRNEIPAGREDASNEMLQIRVISGEKCTHASPETSLLPHRDRPGHVRVRLLPHVRVKLPQGVDDTSRQRSGCRARKGNTHGRIITTA